MPPTPEEIKESSKEALDHAWDWFSLHATQRLQAVNFFLVAVAFLSAAFVTAAKENMHVLAGGIAVVGVCVSFYFYRIDRRIRSLLHAAEAAMRPLEGRLAKRLEINELEIVERVKNPQRGEWHYSKVFRYLFFTTGTAFVLGFFYTVWATFSAAQPSTELRVVICAAVGVFLVVGGYEMLVTPRGRESHTFVHTATPWALFSLGILSVISGTSILLVLALYRLWSSV